MFEDHYSIPLPTPDEMRAWDKTAIEDFHIPQAVLMESAGREALDVLMCEYGPVEDQLALVFAGSGNNGGDALVLARLMADQGAEVVIFHTKSKKTYRGSTGRNMRLAQRLGLPLVHLAGMDPDALPSRFGLPGIVVDGLLGTGFSGPLRPEYERLINVMNMMGDQAFVLALDTPSGVDGLTGEVGATAVRADATVSFEEAKLGLALPRAEPWVGRLHARSIGIPAKIKNAAPAGCGLITARVADLAPEPDPLMHKGHGGHVLIVGGSPGLCGAPALAALGALRSGAGLATVACPGGLAAEARGPRPEVMTLPLETGREWNAKLADEFTDDVLDRFDAVLAGPGLGRSDGARDFLAAFLPRVKVPLILDADALYWLAMDCNLCGRLRPDTMLTPHPGEMARLLGKTSLEIQSDRLDAARTLARDKGCVAVLKGAGTVVADPSGRTLMSPFAVAALAVAGSGDVLGGIAASLAARGLDVLDAAALAVYWHGQSGALLDELRPMRGSLAGEIADTLPEALKEILEHDES